MLQGFQSKIAEVVTTDGRNFALARAIHYIAVDGTEYVLPIGARTDGASTPSPCWSMLPPFGQYWLAAFLHDCAYQNTLQFTDGSKCNLPKDKCDDLLKEAMASLGVNEETIETIYEGVHLGGWKSFEEDRSQ